MLEAVLGAAAEAVLGLALGPEAMVDDDPALRSGAEHRPQVVLHMVHAAAPVAQDVVDTGNTAGMDRIQDTAADTVENVEDTTALQSSRHLK